MRNLKKIGNLINKQLLLTWQTFTKPTDRQFQVLLATIPALLVGALVVYLTEQSNLRLINFQKMNDRERDLTTLKVVDARQPFSRFNASITVHNLGVAAARNAKIVVLFKPAYSVNLSSNLEKASDMVVEADGIDFDVTYRDGTIEGLRQSKNKAIISFPLIPAGAKILFNFPQTLKSTEDKKSINFPVQFYLQNPNMGEWLNYDRKYAIDRFLSIEFPLVKYTVSTYCDNCIGSMDNSTLEVGIPQEYNFSLENHSYREEKDGTKWLIETLNIQGKFSKSEVLSRDFKKTRYYFTQCPENRNPLSFVTVSECNYFIGSKDDTPKLK